MPASAASITNRIVWPANALMLADAAAHTPSTSVAAPIRWNATLVVVPTTLTRRKSALVALEPCARYWLNVSVSVPLAGNVIAGERIDVTPPSMSFTPALAPASRAVTRSFTPLVVVPSCFVPLELVASGSPRSHAPVAAVSVPFGFVCQPRATSKSSWNTTVPPPP